MCFYCGAAPDELHIDHVIPWAFVAEDRVWNLVLACGPCNLDKRDRPPREVNLKRLMERNIRLLAHLKADNVDRLGRYALRDLREFVAVDLGEHLMALLATCRAEGFDEWPGPLTVAPIMPVT